MSKTRNTRPHRVQARDLEPWRMLNWPWAYGGAWSGVKIGRKLQEGAARAHARDELKQLREPEPAVHRHRAKWELH